MTMPLRNPESNKIILEVEFDSLSSMDDQEDSHPSAFAYLHAAGKQYRLERRGDYVENGCVFHVAIDEELIADMKREYDQVAKSLAIPLEIDESFHEYDPEEDDNG